MNGRSDRVFQGFNIGAGTSVPPPPFIEVVAYLRGIADAAVAFPAGARTVAPSDLAGRVATAWPTRSSFAVGRGGGARVIDLEGPRPLTIRYGETVLTIAPHGVVAPALSRTPSNWTKRGGARFVDLEMMSNGPYELATLNAPRRTLPIASSTDDILDAIFGDEERPSAVRLRVPSLPSLPSEWYELRSDVSELGGR